MYLNYYNLHSLCSFTISISKSKKNRIGWQVNISFIIGLHKRDVELLNHIQGYFGGVGIIRKEIGDFCDFKVNSINDLINVIIPHFDKYPLVTMKRADYLLWREVVMMMSQGKHLTESGLQTIINIRATLNKGLSQALKEAFPNNVPVSRPLISPILQLQPQWVAGFTSGEGCFRVSIRKSKTLKEKNYVDLIFVLNQHSRDKLLIRSLVDFFECGNYYSYKDYAEFKCQSFQDNYEKIIPFFVKYKILGIKSEDYKDWCIIAEIIKTKYHLTKEGLDNIKVIQAGMNKGRY